MRFPRFGWGTEWDRAELVSAVQHHTSFAEDDVERLDDDDGRFGSA
ncbi:MAG TPA: hypothetical protein VN781_04215 [Acidimicrobiales bacterium]|nr:hypothetical protein [Acidimicrobiales bacterium]